MNEKFDPDELLRDMGGFLKKQEDKLGLDHSYSARFDGADQNTPKDRVLEIAKNAGKDLILSTDKGKGRETLKEIVSGNEEINQFLISVLERKDWEDDRLIDGLEAAIFSANNLVEMYQARAEIYQNLLTNIELERKEKGLPTLKSNITKSIIDKHKDKF